MASDKLMQVRTMFVERASKNVIQQLLDDLLQDGVLNNGEVEQVVEENDTRANKARTLIDMVRKKGCMASEKFIIRLKERDHMLSQTLALDG